MVSWAYCQDERLRGEERKRAAFVLKHAIQPILNFRLLFCFSPVEQLSGVQTPVGGTDNETPGFNLWTVPLFTPHLPTSRSVTQLRPTGVSPVRAPQRRVVQSSGTVRAFFD